MNYLQKYQEQLGLAPDGIMGPNTAKAMMADLNITSKVNFAIWYAQVEHESGHFKAGRENLNYSADALKKLFGKYFKPGEAEQYARQPEKIANRIYANRMQNGDEASGDGWRYRGAGALQLTGRGNITAYFKSVGLPEDSCPDILLEPKHYFRTAVWFFDTNNVWENCYSTTKECVLACSRHVNLGSPTSKGMPIGFDERLALTNKISQVIGVA